MTAEDDTLRELARLTGMRPRSGPPIDWAAQTDRLGVEPPPDYRELVDRYGCGAFGFAFHVHGPDDHLYELEADWDDHFKDDWKHKPELAPTRPGAADATIVVWATSEDAHLVFWLAEPDRPATEWLIGLQGHDSVECEYFELTTVEFLLALVTGELDSELLWTFDTVAEAAFLSFARLRAGNG